MINKMKASDPDIVFMVHLKFAVESLKAILHADIS